MILVWTLVVLPLINKMEESFTIVQSNLRSSPTALASFEDLIEANSFMVAAIADPPKKLRFCKNYRTRDLRWNCSKDNEAWAGLLIKNDLDYTFVSQPSRTLVSVIIQTSQGPLGVIGFYVKPAEWEQAVNDLDDAIKSMKVKTDKFLIIGDSNGHSSMWSNVDANNEIGDALEDVVCAHGLTVLNDCDSPPTFYDCRGNGHRIDISAASTGLSPQITRWSVLEGEIPESDHDPIVTGINLQSRKVQRRKLDDWTKVDWDSFAVQLDARLTNEGLDSSISLTSQDEIDAAILSLTEIIHHLCEETVPKKTIFWNSNGWYDAEMKKLNQDMKTSKQLWQRSQDEFDKDRYCRDRALFQTKAREKKRNSFFKFCQSLDNESMWNGLSRLSGNRGAQDIDFLQMGDRLISQKNEMNEIADALADKYSGLSVTPPLSDQFLETQRDFSC